jgi:hypothetical protein
VKDEEEEISIESIRFDQTRYSNPIALRVSIGRIVK